MRTFLHHNTGYNPKQVNITTFTNYMQNFDIIKKKKGEYKSK